MCLVRSRGKDRARAWLRTIKGIDVEVDGIRRDLSDCVFRLFVSLLGSVFDEEDAGDVKNEPTCVLLVEKLADFQVTGG